MYRCTTVLKVLISVKYVYQIKDAQTEDMLKEINEDVAILTAAGFVNKFVTSTNGNAALEAAILHHSLTIRKLEMDDIRREWKQYIC
jgi:hypothetical protein